MLKKLMKYDIKNFSKILIYFYVISLFLAATTRLISIGNKIQVISIIEKIFNGITYAALFNIIINTFIHILKVFVTSFYKDESYLTHTLPISKNELLISKYLSSLIIIFISFLVIITSFLIMHYSENLLTSIKVVLNSIIYNLQISSLGFILLISFLVFSQICAIISFAFTAIIKGYSYNRRKSFKSLLWFIVFYLSTMITTFLLIIAICAISGNFSQLFAAVLSQKVFLLLIYIALVTYTLIAILFFFISKKIFNKGVNVD